VRILFISYFFHPFTGVGAKRATYWFDNIQKYGFDACVITATKQLTLNKDKIYIAPEPNSRISSLFIKDEGINWYNPLKRYLKNNKNRFNFDIAIITGGPFMHMRISKFLKNNLHMNVILDFRDPFYRNPRFKSSFIKDVVKLIYQKNILKYADKVITVNKYCSALIKNVSVEIINNGYDDSIIRLVNNYSYKQINKINIVSVGRIYADFKIATFLNVISSSNKYHFHYIGNALPKEFGNNNISTYGQRDYIETLSFIKSADLCVLFTGGHQFESTTKIFDYLAFNKPILLITEGEKETGSLSDIMSRYPNKVWAKNSFYDIVKAIEYILDRDVIRVDVSKFSRAETLDKLIKIIMSTIRKGV